MTARCNKCGKELPADWAFPCCPFCGSPLAAEVAGVSLGDANAFAGDVSISVSNTNIERQKGAEEVKAEALGQYRQLCKQALADGIVTNDERSLLEDARVRLGISAEEARQTFEAAKAGMTRSSKNALGKIQQVTLNQVLKLRDKGKIDNLRSSLGRLETMAQKFDADEVQCNYWMILAGLDPERCIAEYEKRDTDSYWQSFWAAMAYINTGDSASAEGVISDLEAWDDMPFGNIALLAAANSLCEYWKDPTVTDFREQAEAFAEEGASGNTDLIDSFAQALMLLLGADDASAIEEFHDDFLFQLDYVLKGITDRIRSASARDELPPLPKIDLLPE